MNTNYKQCYEVKKNRSGKYLYLDNQGFTLIEVLVAVFVLAIGILGMAGMQAVGVREAQNTYFRTQADMLASDIVDRMRANRTAVVDDSVAPVYENDGSPVSSAPGCDTIGADCSESDMANYDLNAWQMALENSKLPSAKGTVERIAGTTNAYTVQVFWDENRDGVNDEVCDESNNNDSCIRLVVQF